MWLFVFVTLCACACDPWKMRTAKNQEAEWSTCKGVEQSAKEKLHSVQMAGGSSDKEVNYIGQEKTMYVAYLACVAFPS